MYTKKLLALAVATASGAALAGSLGGTATTAAVTPNYTLEGLAAADEVITGTTAIILTTNPLALAANSLLRLTYNNGLVADGGAEFTGFPSTLEIDSTSYLTGTYASQSAFATNGTLSLVSQDGSAGTAVYQLQAANLPTFTNTAGTAGTTADDIDYSTLAVGLTSAISLPSPFMSTSGLTTGTLSAVLETIAGTQVETASGTILTTSGSQMAGGTITGNATIDVNQAREQFVDNAGVNADTTALVLTFDKDALAAGATKIAGSTALTTGTVAITITGQDFNWLDSDVTTTGIQAGNVTGLSSVVITGTTISGVLDTATDVEETVTVTLDNDEDAVIPVQTGITASAQIFYPRETGGNGSTTVALSGAAVWTLNGSSIDIYAVPQSANVSNFMWLTNTGTGSVAVDATIFDGAQTCEMTSIGTSVAGTEFDLTAAIDANKAVQCPTYVPSGNRVRINVSANAPAASLRVSAAYRVGTDRVNLLTSSEAGL
jgi:hypothetical protein